jgi:hypothetical protein
MVCTDRQNEDRDASRKARQKEKEAQRPLACLLYCRRSLIAIFSVTCLTWIALSKGTDTSSAIAAIVLGIAGANASEKVGIKLAAKNEKNQEKQEDKQSAE